MKNFFLLTLFFPIMLMAQFPNNGLVGHWRFNGNTDDASGNSNNATLVGGVTLTKDRNMEADRAYKLNGTDGHINIDNVVSSLSNTDKGTWIVNLKLNSHADFQRIIGFGDTDASSRIELYTSSSGSVTGVARENGVNQWAFTAGSNTLLQLNQWHQLALVHDGAACKLFIDGQEVPLSYMLPHDKDRSYWFDDIEGIDNGNIGFTDYLATGILHISADIDYAMIYDQALTETDLFTINRSLNTYSGQSYWKPGATIGNIQYAEGGVSIGTETVPSGFQLAVNGKVLATDVEVIPYSQWPDYVFDSAYERMTLEETANFIEVNQHLPGIPSEKEMKSKSSYSLSQMNALLLEKIEEITLHLIDLKKENDQMKAEIKELTK